MRILFRKTFLLLSTFLLVASGFCVGEESVGTSRNLSIVPKSATRRALIIALGSWKDKQIQPLSGAKPDAELMCEALKKLDFPEENIVVLTTGVHNDPTKEKIDSALNEFFRACRKGDFVFIMLCGHGWRSETQKVDYLIPYDGKINWGANGFVESVDTSTCVSIDDLKTRLSESPATFKWLLVDACRERLTAKGVGRSSFDNIGSIESAEGVLIFQSCSKGELSREDRWEGEDEDHGLFTWTLVQGLSGKAADSDGNVSILDAFNYAHNETVRLSNDRYKMKQEPVSSQFDDFKDFIISQGHVDPAQRLYEEGLELELEFDYEGALEKYRLAFAKKSDEKLYRNSIDKVTKILVSQHTDKGWELLGDGDYDGAAEEADAALSFSPSDVGASALRKQAKVKKSEETIRKLLEKGEEYFSDKEYRLALLEANKVLALEPVNSGGLDLKKRCEEAIKGGDWGTASEAGTRRLLSIKGKDYAFRYCPPTGAQGFLMGSPENESGRYGDENQHKVVLTEGFWLLETEITQKLWEEVMGNNPSCFKGANLPVERISWDDVNTFIKKLNSGGYAPEGYVFRLPTEAQWEYACRADNSGAYGGMKLEDCGWYSENSDGKTHEVGLKQSNAWGLKDMHGNVFEWCYDSYESKLTDATDPCYDEQGASRVNRGGGWYDVAQSCRAACRNCNSGGYQSDGLGARLALVRKH